MGIVTVRLMARSRFVLFLSCALVLGSASWPYGAAAEKAPTLSTPNVGVPADLELDSDSGLYVAVVDVNTIEISLPDDSDEIVNDSVLD